MVLLPLLHGDASIQACPASSKLSVAEKKFETDRRNTLWRYIPNVKHPEEKESIPTMNELEVS